MGKKKNEITNPRVFSIGSALLNYIIQKGKKIHFLLKQIEAMANLSPFS